MIKTNVHPYVYMSKYALKHFEENANLHKNQNLMLYTSSMAATMDMTYFGVYAGTKTFNFAFANLIRKGCKRSTVFGDLL